MSTRKAFGDQLCSIARTLDIVGDWWTLLVLRDVFRGTRRFDDLKRGLDIATNVLTARLKHLTDAGILERRAYQDHPPRFEYDVTAKGRDLYPVLIALAQYGDRHLRAAANDDPPRVLVHDACGHVSNPALMCSHCGTEVSARNARTVSRAELTATGSGSRSRSGSGSARASRPTKR
ncbi:MAG TPA: helix-turn-helix domain-containing protein [Candidatus Elarobacter sp.]|nr:helix-turn-helix domain-containing protein [Candidatus Elarobacter sp.]